MALQPTSSRTSEQQVTCMVVPTLSLTRPCNMQDIVPANVMIPPGRLRSLIEQALKAQGSAVACYDNRIEPSTSLFFDAAASIQCLPISCTQILSDHRDQVLSVAFSPDGSWLASCSQDGRVGFWQVRSNAPMFRLHLLLRILMLRGRSDLTLASIPPLE